MNLWRFELHQFNTALRRNIAWHSQKLDYAWFLPALAHMPVKLASMICRWRGLLNARHARDWAELALGFSYIGERTAQAAARIWPHEDAKQMVRERYISVAREEWHAALIHKHKLSSLHFDLCNLRHMLEGRQPDRGLVVLTAHFDSFIVGMIGLGMCGEATSVTTSNVYQNPQVHPDVQRFFDLKYQRAAQYMGGGKFLHVETSLNSLAKALRRHETVVVVADAPSATQENSVCISWMGKRRRLANGAIRLAQSTHSLVCAMVCITDHRGHVRWLCSDIHDPETDQASFQKCFEHLESAILSYPGRWWAAHLLEDYVCCDQTDD